ncbi:MAG: hypothetical protein ACRCTA_06895, partial [Bacilli bacterium]
YFKITPLKEYQWLISKLIFIYLGVVISLVVFWGIFIRKAVNYLDFVYVISTLSLILILMAYLITKLIRNLNIALLLGSLISIIILFINLTFINSRDSLVLFINKIFVILMVNGSTSINTKITLGFSCGIIIVISLLIMKDKRLQKN